MTASVVQLPQSDRVLERLMRLHPKVIDLSLDRVYRLLERLGDPQHRLPPVVHVAGTNGKGSTVAYLRAILEDAGNKVHVYTSPHLVRFHERIRLAGRLIDEGALVALLEECERVNGPEPITLFEITTVAAFLASAPAVGEMIDDIARFIRKWLPSYVADNRNYVTVAIGCTGGRHRSVYIVEQLAQRFADHEHVLVRHRSTDLTDRR